MDNNYVCFTENLFKATMKLAKGSPLAFLCLVGTPPFDVNPMHSFINETPSSHALLPHTVAQSFLLFLWSDMAFFNW